MLSKIILLAGWMISVATYARATDKVSVPEPESMSLIAIGLGLICVIVARKK